VPVRGDFVAIIGTIDMTGMALETKTKIGIETGIAMTTEIEATHGETVKILHKIESDSKHALRRTKARNNERIGKPTDRFSIERS
jgi:hypothetical protein